MDPLVASLLFGSTLVGAHSQHRTNQDMINLSNTAYQRSMADMRKAGLNPILASKFGGSSVPTLTAPFNAGTLSSATQMAQMPSSIDKDVSQTTLNFEQVKNLESARSLNDAQIRQISAQIPLIKQQLRTEIQKTRLNFYNTGYTIAQTEGQLQNNIIRSVISNTIQELGLPDLPAFATGKAKDFWSTYGDGLKSKSKSIFYTVKDLVQDLYDDLLGESGSISNYFSGD